VLDKLDRLKYGTSLKLYNSISDDLVNKKEQKRVTMKNKLISVLTFFI
tara:strand:- start:623 stop:766 length:144 start_codon:yes stop_codon:yes gene_type:complete